MPSTGTIGGAKGVGGAASAAAAAAATAAVKVREGRVHVICHSDLASEDPTVLQTPHAQAIVIPAPAAAAATAAVKVGLLHPSQGSGEGRASSVSHPVARYGSIQHGFHGAWRCGVCEL